MAKARWIMLVWPGLTQLWFAGAWWGLALACGFGCLVDLALISTFVWDQWIEPAARVGLWTAIAAVWCTAAVLSVRQLSAGAGPDGAAAEDLFRRAGREYLTGNWIRAEQLLTHLIRINQRDVDAQLMLAALLRRTGQWTEASQRLRRLQATDGAEKWSAEIARERQLLQDQIQQQQTEPIQTDDHPIEEKPPANQAA